MTHLQPWSIHINLNTLPETSARFIPASVWSDVIAPEVLKQCDALDGVSDFTAAARLFSHAARQLTDGIVADPRACRYALERRCTISVDPFAASFRPETLTCRPGQNTSTCLTGAQIFALHRIYSNYVETNQTYIFGPYFPGGELGFFNGLVGSSPFQLSVNYFQFFVLKLVMTYIPRVLD